MLFLLIFPEPPAAGRPAAGAPAGARDGDDYVLTGAKAFISGGGASDVFVGLPSVWWW